MGCDAIATLFWGIAYDDGDLDHEGLDQSDEFWSRINDGLAGDRERVNPKPTNKSDVRSAKWNAWRKKDSELAASQPIFHWHGYDQEHRYYVAIKQAKIEWVDTLEIPPNFLYVDPNWWEQLRVFCDRFGLPWKEPKWWLVAYYG